MIRALSLASVRRAPVPGRSVAVAGVGYARRLYRGRGARLWWPVWSGLWRPSRRSLHGFPTALTSFVGRAGAAAEIADHLGRYRLVTVTGPGGVGKTRLAGEVARQVAGRFADGV